MFARLKRRPLGRLSFRITVPRAQLVAELVVELFDELFDDGASDWGTPAATSWRTACVSGGSASPEKPCVSA